MSDPGMELLTEGTKTVVSEVIKPVKEIVGDVFGGLLGDRLHNWRRRQPAWQERNQRDTAEKAAEISYKRGVKHAAEDVNPTEIEAILELAKDTKAKELQDLFAGLIAAAIDPDRILGYRREYAELIKKMEPVDALVLKEFEKLQGRYFREYEKDISNKLEISKYRVVVSARNLERLNLLSSLNINAGGLSITALGREFLAVVSD